MNIYLYLIIGKFHCINLTKYQVVIEFNFELICITFDTVCTGVITGVISNLSNFIPPNLFMNILQTIHTFVAN